MRDILSPNALCTAPRHFEIASLTSFGSCGSLLASPPPKTFPIICSFDDGTNKFLFFIGKNAVDGTMAATIRRSKIHGHLCPLPVDNDASLGLLFRSTFIFDSPENLIMLSVVNEYRIVGT